MKTSMKKAARQPKTKSSVSLTTRQFDSGWRDDEKVVKLRKKLRKFALESEEFFRESKQIVMEAQKERVSARRLTHRDVASRGQERLVNSIGHDKARRSRIVEIEVEALDRVQFIKNALSIARRDIKNRYGPSLKKEFGAITNQHDGIEDYFSTAVRASKEGELLIKIIDLVISDIDKGQLSDKSLQKAADLIFHPSRSD